MIRKKCHYGNAQEPPGARLLGQTADTGLPVREWAEFPSQAPAADRWKASYVQQQNDCTQQIAAAPAALPSTSTFFAARFSIARARSREPRAT